jgi:hypothetical protein
MKKLAFHNWVVLSYHLADPELRVVDSSLRSNGCEASRRRAEQLGPLYSACLLNCTMRRLAVDVADHGHGQALALHVPARRSLYASMQSGHISPKGQLRNDPSRPKSWLLSQFSSGVEGCYKKQLLVLDAYLHGTTCCATSWVGLCVGSSQQIRIGDCTSYIEACWCRIILRVVLPIQLCEALVRRSEKIIVPKGPGRLGRSRPRFCPLPRQIPEPNSRATICRRKREYGRIVRQTATAAGDSKCPQEEFRRMHGSKPQ